MGRVLLAALLGGALVFGGGYLGHEVLMLGEGSVKSAPHEDAVMKALKDNIPAPGFYLAPWKDMSKDLTPEQKTAENEKWQQRYKVGPNAVILRGPDGQEFDMTRHLLFEAASDIVAALLVALAISFVGAGGGFLGRWLACILIGIFGAVSITASYWIWYYLPTDYLKAELMEQALEWAIGGLAIAAIVKPRKPS